MSVLLVAVILILKCQPYVLLPLCSCSAASFVEVAQTSLSPDNYFPIQLN